MTKILSRNIIIQGIKIFFLISTVTLFGIFLFSSSKSSIPVLKQINPIFIILAVFLSFIDFAAGGLRLFIFQKKLSNKVSFIGAVKSNLCTIFSTAITPSQIGGGPSQIYALRKEGLKFSEAVATTIVSFSTTIFFILFCAIIVTIFSGKSLLHEHIVLRVLFRTTSIIFIVFAGLFIFSIFKPDIGKILIYKIMKFFSGKKDDSPKISKFFRRTIRIIREYNYCLRLYLREGKSTLLVGTSLASIIYINKFLIAYIIVLALGHKHLLFSGHIHLLFEVMYIQVLILFISYFSPSPGASGVAEISSALLMSKVLPSNYLPIYTVLWRTFTLYLGAGFGGFVMLKYLGKDVKT